MLIEGLLVKSGNWWAVEVPLLRLFTQGKTKKEAYAMVGSMIEEAIEHPEFKVKIHPGLGNGFLIEPNDINRIFSFAIRQCRDAQDITVREAAKKMGQKSQTGVARYETGETKMTLQKFTEIMAALDEDWKPVISLRRIS